MAASRVEMLNGEYWALFRDYDRVTNRQRRPWSRWRARWRAGERPETDADFAELMYQTLLYMYAEQWSLDAPVPLEWDLFLLWWDDQEAEITDVFAIEALRHHNGGTLVPADKPDEVEDPSPPSP